MIKNTLKAAVILCSLAVLPGTLLAGEKHASSESASSTSSDNTVRTSATIPLINEKFLHSS